MSRIYQRSKGGPWWGDWNTPTGKRVQRSLRTTDKKVARERLQQAELAETPTARGRRQRLSEAIDYMIGTLTDKAEGTIEMYQEKGRRIITTMGDPWVADITKDSLQEYIRRRLDKNDSVHGNASPHTVQKEMITIRRSLREANDRGFLKTMPPFPRHSPKYKPRETWLTPDQFEAVCGELAPERRLWASVAALAGGSAGEVERVEWTGINLIETKMRLPGTKRETRDRWVPIAPALMHRLDAVPKRDRHGKLVQSWGNVRRDLRAAVDRVNRKAAAAAAASGAKPPEPLPYVSPNDLRRTFASWLVQNGVPLLTVAVLMGHSSTRMVEKVYGKLSKQNMDDAIAALPTFGRPTVTTVSQTRPRSALQPPYLDPNDDDHD